MEEEAIGASAKSKGESIGEGEIVRRRWNRTEKVKSFGKGDQRYVFFRPMFFVLFRAWI